MNRLNGASFTVIYYSNNWYVKITEVSKTNSLPYWEALAEKF